MKSGRQNLLPARVVRNSRNANQTAQRIRLAVGLYFVLCVTLSGLLFTYTISSTLDQHQTDLDGKRILRNPFRKVMASRTMPGIEEQQQHGQQQDQAIRENISASISKDILNLRQSSSLHSVSQQDDPLSKDTLTPQQDSPNKQVRDKPVIPFSLEDVPEPLRIDEDELVVQIINTRFMQHQPDLMELGFARLQLLQTICLPTMLQQTSHNFLWIIRADPSLAEPIKTGLLQMIQTAASATPYFHVIVLGSNDSPNGFRHPLVDAPEQVWTNNYALLQHFQRAAQTRIVLETRLDADDGLHLEFIERIQEEAIERLQESRAKNWLVWCVGTHVEWQYGTPWEYLQLLQNDGNNNSTEQDQEMKAANKTDSSLGSLMPGLIRGCITPGLTQGYGTNVNYDDIPPAQHQMMHLQVKACKRDADPPRNEHCLVFWKRVIPAAIRGRTPTSAGMQFVLGKHMSSHSPQALATLGLDKGGADNLLYKQYVMWDSVQDRFGITRDSVRKMRQFLKEHMHGIVQDNYDGQCTQGHSCKNSSRIILKQLLEETDSSQIHYPKK